MGVKKLCKRRCEIKYIDSLKSNLVSTTVMEANELYIGKYILTLGEAKNEMQKKISSNF